MVVECTTSPQNSGPGTHKLKDLYPIYLNPIVGLDTEPTGSKVPVCAEPAW